VTLPLAMTPAPSGTSDLAALLKSATAIQHRRIERSPFMRLLLAGTLPRTHYVLLIHNLRALYGSLEPALLHHAADPALAPLQLHRLFRSASLADDQAALSRAHDPRPALLPAMVAYTARLRELRRVAPVLLTAHAYVRYLGDLNGGQALGIIVARAYGLGGGSGTRFYDFGPDATRRQWIEDFRVGLRAAGQQVLQPQAIVAEAIGAFERHAALFDELAADL
jgi:heme oxygenase